MKRNQYTIPERLIKWFFFCIIFIIMNHVITVTYLYILPISLGKNCKTRRLVPGAVSVFLEGGGMVGDISLHRFALESAFIVRCVFLASSINCLKFASLLSQGLQTRCVKFSTRSRVCSSKSSPVANNSTFPRLKIFFAFFGSQIFIHKRHEELAICFPCLK